jgi:DNA-binding TFAR19-related protein (PDSD5 family)
MGMPSAGMLRRVALVRPDISEELRTSIIRVTRIGQLGTLAVASKRGTLRRTT